MGRTPPRRRIYDFSHPTSARRPVQPRPRRRRPLGAARLRTYTPTQAVLSRGAGAFLWTPEGRRLYDFTSGVLVVNLGHNPQAWMERFKTHMAWSYPAAHHKDAPRGFSSAVPLTAYNAVTELEIETTRRLIDVLQDRPGGKRLEQVMWAASGSEAIQKALWAALARDRRAT